MKQAEKLSFDAVYVRMQGRCTITIRSREGVASIQRHQGSSSPPDGKSVRNATSLVARSTDSAPKYPAVGRCSCTIALPLAAIAMPCSSGSLKPMMKIVSSSGRCSESSRVRESIVAQFAAVEQRVDQHQPRFRAVAHRHRNRAVQFDDRRGLEPQQHVVQADDLRPVGRLRARRLCVHRGDRSLQCVRPDASRAERALDPRNALANLRAVPARAVLVGEQHEFTVLSRPRRAARVVQQHQGQQPHGLGFGQQLDQQPSET